MSSAKSVPVVPVKLEESKIDPEVLTQFTMMMLILDQNRLRAMHLPEKWQKTVEGMISLMTDLADFTNRIPGLSKIPILPAENVPLYCIQSTRTPIANGEVKSFVGEVNTRSLDVLMENSNTGITGLIRTPSTIPQTMFREFATTVTIFGTLKMTRLTIPMKFREAILEKPQNSNLLFDVEESTEQQMF